MLFFTIPLFRDAKMSADFPGFRQIKTRAFPQSPAKTMGERRWRTRDLRFSKRRRKKEKKTPSSLPFGKMAKKGRRPKSGGTAPRRFRSLRPPTLYRNKPNVLYQDSFRFLVDLSYKIKYFFQEGKKNPVFSPLSVIFTCIFITYIV